MQPPDAAEIFNDALDLAPEERPEFLDRRCGGDAELRAEVDTLLSIHERFPAPPLPDAGGPPPSHIGRYRILGELGRGGMGTVYLAEDPTLGRRVALKMLPARLGRDTERFVRFRREAQILASLNHPNVATLFSLEEPAGSAPFLTMELMTGETLSTRLSACPAGQGLRVAEVLRIGVQMARAIQAAHGRGIIHRDLKPSNVALSSDGDVKVLDFGLAKVMGDGESGFDAAAASFGDSGRPDDTIPGTVLGSPGYMSPEQIRGGTVTPASDLWAFGCVLFECLSGRPAFPGATAADRMSAALEREPQWKALPGGLPAALRRLLRDCLEKDPARRMDSASRLRSEMERIAASAGVFAPERGAPRWRQLLRRDSGRESRWTVVVILGALIPVGLVAWLWLARAPISHDRDLPDRVSNFRRAPNSRAATLRQITFTGSVLSFELSPDDRRVAYTTPSGALVIHDLASGRATEIYRRGELYGPRWSPDGSEILVSRADSTATVLTYLIGPETRSARRIGPPGFRGFDWTRDGRGVAGVYWPPRKANTQRLLVVDLVTGDTLAFSKPPDLSVLLGLSCSGMGDQILCHGSSVTGDGGIWVAPRIDAPLRRVELEGKGWRWSRTGDALLYLATHGGLQGLWRVSVDSRTGRSAVPELVETTGEVAGFAPFHLDDRILYRVGQFLTTLWLLERGPEGDWTERPTYSGTVQLYQPRVSPDGRRIAVGRSSAGVTDIGIIHLAGGTPQWLASAAAGRIWTTWSPDGRSIAYRGGPSNPQVWILDIERGESRIASKQPCYGYIYWWPADQLRYQPAAAAHQNYLFLDEVTGVEEPFLPEPLGGTLFQSAVSPDGRWMAVAGNRNDIEAVAVWLIDRLDGSERLLFNKPAAPIGWSRDGAWVYAARVDYETVTGVTETAEVIRISVQSQRAETVAKLPPGDLGEWSNADISPDGDRIVATISQRGLDLWVSEGVGGEGL